MRREIITAHKVNVDFEVRQGVSRSVLRNASISVRENDLITISGPSGSGKTTLLRALANLIPGCEGVSYTSPDAIDRVIMVTQEPHLLPFLTVRENLELLAHDQELVSSALKMFNLEKVADSYHDELSGGEKTRASLARAVVTREDAVLLLDEPTANLDLKHVEMMMRILSSLWKQGHTLVIVTHSEDLFKIGRRKFILSRGELKEL